MKIRASSNGSVAPPSTSPLLLDGEAFSTVALLPLAVLALISNSHSSPRAVTSDGTWNSVTEGGRSMHSTPSRATRNWYPTTSIAPGFPISGCGSLRRS
jgi:hypothetical protein